MKKGKKKKIKSLCCASSYNLKNASCIWHVCKSLPGLKDWYSSLVIRAITPGLWSTKCFGGNLSKLWSSVYKVALLFWQEVGLKKSWVGMVEIKPITVISRNTLKFKSVICAPAQRAKLSVSWLAFNVLSLTWGLGLNRKKTSVSVWEHLQISTCFEGRN